MIYIIETLEFPSNGIYLLVKVTRKIYFLGILIKTIISYRINYK